MAVADHTSNTVQLEFIRGPVMGTSICSQAEHDVRGTRSW